MIACPICAGRGNYVCAWCNNVGNEAGAYGDEEPCEACNETGCHDCGRCASTGQVSSYEKYYDDSNELRDIDLDGYRLQLWDTGQRKEVLRSPSGHALSMVDRTKLAYRLTDPDDVVIFESDDFGSSPMNAIDDDDTVRSLLGFLTLRRGDTDEEYFYQYTRRQADFAENEAEALSLWCEVPQDTEPDEPFFQPWVVHDVQVVVKIGKDLDLFTPRQVHDFEVQLNPRELRKFVATLGELQLGKKTK